MIELKWTIQLHSVLTMCMSNQLQVDPTVWAVCLQDSETRRAHLLFLLSCLLDSWPAATEVSQVMAFPLSCLTRSHPNFWVGCYFYLTRL